MFISAGTPGDAKKVQASVAAARKVFRILRPLESLTPLVLNPAINPKKPLFVELLNKIKPILMSVYFGGDHVVWASQAGLLTNKDITQRAQKASLYGWFGGSLCTIVTEIYECNRKLLIYKLKS
jgi:Peroxisomal biogenesis factor 11 (PEX11)